jgi:hypothetical protein
MFVGFSILKLGSLLYNDVKLDTFGALWCVQYRQLKKDSQKLMPCAVIIPHHKDKTRQQDNKTRQHKSFVLLLSQIKPNNNRLKSIFKTTRQQDSKKTKLLYTITNTIIRTFYIYILSCCLK